MNYSKYHQTANFTSGNPASGHSSHQNFGQPASSRGASSNSRIYHQGSSSNIREGQSVERLKSCIADLKKLATSKVKRGSSQAAHLAGGSKRDRVSVPSGDDTIMNYQYGGSSREGSTYQSHSYAATGYSTATGQKQKQTSIHQTATPEYAQAPGSSKRPSKSSLHNQSTSHQSASIIGQVSTGRDQIGSNGERKQHSTKIANALKKYIHDIEATTSQLSHVTSGGARGYPQQDTSRTGRDSHRARSSNQQPYKRSSTAGKTLKDSTIGVRHTATNSSVNKTDRESHNVQNGYPISTGYVNPHMAQVASSSKQAPRAHSSKNLGGTSSSRTTNVGFIQENPLVQAQLNPLNQSKRSVATAQQMENSMKMSHLPAGYSAGDSNLIGSEPQSYSRQPRKAQSQDRIVSASAGGAPHHQNTHSSNSNQISNNLGQSTFNNLNSSVLAQQKRSSSTHHYKSSATKKSQYTGSTKKQSQSGRPSSGYGAQSSHVANHTYGQSTQQQMNDTYNSAKEQHYKKGTSVQVSQQHTERPNQNYKTNTVPNEHLSAHFVQDNSYSHSFSDPSAKQSSSNQRQPKTSSSSSRYEEPVGHYNQKTEGGMSEIEKRRPSNNAEVHTSVIGQAIKSQQTSGNSELQSKPRLLQNNFMSAVANSTASQQQSRRGEPIIYTAASHVLSQQHVVNQSSQSVQKQELLGDADEEARLVLIDQSQNRVRDGFKKANQSSAYQLEQLQANTGNKRTAASEAQSGIPSKITQMSQNNTRQLNQVESAAVRSQYLTNNTADNVQSQQKLKSGGNFAQTSDTRIQLLNSYDQNIKKQSQPQLQQATSYQQQATPVHQQNASSIYSIQQAANGHMTSSTLQQTASAAAVNNIQAGITYKTSLMRTNAGNCREDMNIEDIFCQIVMRKQRNNQLLRELEGGVEDFHHFGDQAGDTTETFSRHNTVKPNSLMATGEHSRQNCIAVKDVEILGPDYCSKRPVFLPLHFPEMLVNQQQLGQQQAQQNQSTVISTSTSAAAKQSTAPQKSRQVSQPPSSSKLSGAPRPNAAFSQQASSSSQQQQSRRVQQTYANQPIAGSTSSHYKPKYVHE